MSQAKHLKQLLTKEIHLLSEAKIRVFSQDFCALFLIFNFSSAYCVTGETVETTDQRNSSIIGKDKIYISSKKREEMQFIYLFDESR